MAKHKGGKGFMVKGVTEHKAHKGKRGRKKGGHKRGHKK